MALCWLEFRANTESTSSHGIGPMGTQAYVMGTISWRTMQEPNRTLLSAPGLIQKERLFTPEQMTEIYRCCADSVDGDFFELTESRKK